MQTAEDTRASVRARPFVKWVGGKTRLLPELLSRLPTGVDSLRYVEPFLGGGALFFRLEPKNAWLTDDNESLIATYRAVRDDVDEVIGGLEVLAAEHSADRYDEVRALYNDSALPAGVRAAMFIYLNRTCFNGLYRVNSKGKFNVPMGAYVKPRILDVDGLRAASAALQGAKLSAASFEFVLRECQMNDFVYCDPPYAPMTETSFTSYTEDDFRDDMQRRLAESVLNATARGVKIMISQSDTPLTRELYKPLRIEVVTNTRSVNSDPLGRGKVSELLIRNY